MRLPIFSTCSQLNAVGCSRWRFHSSVGCCAATGFMLSCTSGLSERPCCKSAPMGGGQRCELPTTITGFAVSTLDSRCHSTADSEQLGTSQSTAEITSMVMLGTTKGRHRRHPHDQLVVGSYNVTTGSYSPSLNEPPQAAQHIVHRHDIGC
jgi:hypothetical protein